MSLVLKDNGRFSSGLGLGFGVYGLGFEGLGKLSRKSANSLYA